MADKIYPTVPTPPMGPAPNGAYYNMKDQPMPPPATYRDRRSNRSCWCCCLSSMCGIFTTLIFLFGLFVLIWWLVVNPKDPQFNVERVFITGLNANSTTQNTDIAYQIMAYNPNKHADFYYSDVNAIFTANGQEIGAGNIPDFSQGHKDTTYIGGNFISNDLTLSTGTLQFVAKDLTYVPLYAEVDAKSKVETGSNTWVNHVKVKCNIWVDLTVTSGSMLKKSDCSFSTNGCGTSSLCLF